MLQNNEMKNGVDVLLFIKNDKNDFRGKFDEIFVFPKYVCVLRNCTLIYHVAMCLKSIARD